MKNKQKNDYSLFKRKLFRRISLIIGATGVVLFILQSLARGVFGEWFVDFLQNQFFMTKESAFYVHQYIFRNNLLILTIGVSLGAVVIIFSLYTHFVTRYFDEISTGLDQMVDNSDTPVTLSAELQSLEAKMTKGKQVIQKKARDAKEAEERKNELVVYLAHDIRTPLTSVIGYLNLLEETGDLPRAQQEKYLQLTLSKAYRLETLINEFFDITRFNIQEIILNKEPIDLQMMASQIADEFSLTAAEKNQTISVNQLSEISVLADPDKLGRVFSNIIQNALSYSFVNSEIVITIERVNQLATIRFTSHGTVIPESMQEMIFDKFYRLDTSRSTTTGGAGLGLAIAKEIVVAHGGTIEMVSSAEATSFTVALPMEERA